MNDAGATPSLAPAPDVGVPGGLEAALLASGEGTGSGEAGTGGSAGDAGKLSATAKLNIEREARRAAWERNGCPYERHSLEWEHWLAVYVLAGGLIR